MLAVSVFLTETDVSPHKTGHDFASTASAVNFVLVQDEDDHLSSRYRSRLNQDQQWHGDCGGFFWIRSHRISSPKQINFQFCEEYGRCKGYQIRSYTSTHDYYKCLWRCQVYGRIFWIQCNLDNTCPDSMLYRLVRHFLPEHITYFVTENKSLSTWNWVACLIALKPKGTYYPGCSVILG